MIFAFSFAASRAPEWSGGISSTARSYAALTSDGISSAFAYSRPLNRMFVLVLAFTTRPVVRTIFREIQVLRLWRQRERSGLRGLCLREYRCSADRESLFEWHAARVAHRKRDRSLRAQAAPSRSRTA